MTWRRLGPVTGKERGDERGCEGYSGRKPEEGLDRSRKYIGMLLGEITQEGKEKKGRW